MGRTVRWSCCWRVVRGSASRILTLWDVPSISGRWVGWLGGWRSLCFIGWSWFHLDAALGWPDNLPLLNCWWDLSFWVLHPIWSVWAWRYSPAIPVSSPLRTSGYSSLFDRAPPDLFQCWAWWQPWSSRSVVWGRVFSSGRYLVFPRW